MLRRFQFEPLEARVVLAGTPTITEFQAINESTLQDDDGDFSDWIEISNQGTESVNLESWYLTDDAADLRKWALPDITLASSEQLLVFASGKERSVGSIHANFKLSGSGEFLALVRPDGVTVEQDFGDQYPPQFPNQSYGLGIARETTFLVDKAAPVKAFVPQDDSLGMTWIAPDFDDSGWASGESGIGFEVLNPATRLVEEFDAELGPDWTVDIPEGSASTVTIGDGVMTLDVPVKQDITFDDRGLAPMVLHDVPTDDPPLWEFVTHVGQPSASKRGVTGVVIVERATGLPAIQFELTSRTNFRAITAGGEIKVPRVRAQKNYGMRVVRDNFEKTWAFYALLENTDEWDLMLTLTDGMDGVPVVDDPVPGVFARTPSSTMLAEIKSVEIIIPSEPPVYSAEAGLNVAQQMLGTNSSVYLRIPFRVEGNPTRLDGATATHNHALLLFCLVGDSSTNSCS